MASLSKKSSSPSSKTTASSIDDVTKSFAASLALANSKVIDVSARISRAPRTALQSFLLAKPLSRDPPSVADLKKYTSRVWVLDRKFQIQQRPNNMFVFAFDLIKDRNKVLRGGPWWYLEAPIVIQPYDGMAPIQSAAMDSLYFWVRIGNTPPFFEIPKNFPVLGAVAGKYLEYDDKTWRLSRQLRVRVERKLSEPIFSVQTLKLDTKVEAEIQYFFERSKGTCPDCYLVYHEDGRCYATPSTTNKHAGSMANKPVEFAVPGLGFAASHLVNGQFRFQGTQQLPIPSMAPPKAPSRKPVLRRQPEADALAIVPIQVPADNTQDASIDVDASGKRSHPCSPYTSPKKLKVLCPNALQPPIMNELPLKKLRQPKVVANFSSKSLGLIEAPNGTIVRKEKRVEKEKPKKKRGRPYGSKNKPKEITEPTPDQEKKIADAQKYCFAYLSAPPCPSLKGKEIV